METILDKILAVKKREVEALKMRLKTIFPKTYPTRSLISKLENANDLAIIAEFKRASPSKGDINLEMDPGIQAKIYRDAGADAVSVLTDHSFFKGSFEDLEAVRSVVDVPILCKDFIIDSLQVDAAKQAGADVILLIAAALDDQQLYDLYQYALEQDLEVLMEIHNEKEAERVLKTNNRLIGVNNRNLKTFEVDLNVTEKMGPIIKKERCFLISESGMKTVKDVAKVVTAGANGILVGETFMRHACPANIIQEMKLPLPEGSSR